MKSRIENIGQLIAIPPGPIRGHEQATFPIIENAALLIDDDRIAWFGPSDQAPHHEAERIIDAEGGLVVPGLIDCHTHVVFAGSREGEFVQRIGGADYLEILEAGGGINNSVRALRAASLDDLIAQSRPRLQRMLEWGVTTVEAKSGYGLTPDDEIKTLRAIHRLGDELPLDLVATFLGAHTIPSEYEGRPDDYLDAITAPAVLDKIVADHLAEFADAFCERGAFTLGQSRRFLVACRDRGLVPKIHTEQLTATGGTKLAVQLGAASADHLECIDDDMIESLKVGPNSPVAPPSRRCVQGQDDHATEIAESTLSGSQTMPVLLPGCSFFLGSAPAPARKMIDAGLPVALATDCNPGSCMIESLPLIMSIASVMLRMTPAECLVACTANAAAALNRADRLGAVAEGFLADLLILDIPNVDRWVYQVGVNPVRKVIKAGRVVLER